MALNFYELAISRTVTRAVDSASVTLKWIAMYSLDENAVATGLLAVAPLTWDSLKRYNFKLEPLGAGVWMCDVEYAFNPLTQTDTPGSFPTPDDSTALGPEFGFDLTAGQAHIVQSRATRYRWLPGTSTTTPAGDAIAAGANLTVDGTTNTLVTPDGYTPVAGDVGKILLVSGAQNDNPAWGLGGYNVTAVGGGQWTLNTSPAPVTTAGGLWTLINPTNLGTAPDYKQAIGVTRDRVEGTDIYDGKFEFTLTAQTYPVNLPYLRKIRAMTPTINASAWYGFNAGEVLFLGATGQCTPGNVWRVTYKFAVGQNLYAVPVSVDAATGVPRLVVPYKGAWEYLWCAYGPDTDGKRLLEIPQAAYVEKVYRYSDFTQLGVG